MIGIPGDGFPTTACAKLSCVYLFRLPCKRNSRLSKSCLMRFNFSVEIITMGYGATLLNCWSHTLLLWCLTNYNNGFYVDIPLWLLVLSLKLSPLMAQPKIELFGILCIDTCSVPTFFVYVGFSSYKSGWVLWETKIQNGLGHAIDFNY